METTFALLTFTAYAKTSLGWCKILCELEPQSSHQYKYSLEFCIEQMRHSSPSIEI